MLKSKIGLVDFELLLDAVSDFGGGGGEPSQDPGGDPAAEPSQSAEPSVLEISDPNVLIKYPGADKPVKFSEYGRQFQAQATRAQQERARIAAELQREREMRQRYEAERQRAQGQNQGAEQDPYEQLRQLPYLSGEQAAGVIQNIATQIGQRDQIILGLAKELQKVQRIVSGLNETHSSQAFDAKISKFLQDGGYDPEWADFAKELYLAYEGDDLDYEFPNILAKRIEQAERLLTKRREAAVRAAKPAPFLPGRGGDGRPSKPLQLNPAASAKETADMLWESLQRSGT